jgi:tetratricopeptide (TPR) repeat protein
LVTEMLTMWWGIRWGVIAGAALVLAGCAAAPDYIRKGNELYAQGKYAEAALNYRKAIQKQPNSGEAHYRLGLALMKDGKRVEAHQAFTQALAVAPQMTEAKVQLADLKLTAYRADPRRPQNLYQELTKLAADLLAQDPGSTDGWRIQGSLALLDQKPAEALEAFRKANEIKPLEPEVVRGMIEALMALNQPAEAEKLGLALLAKDKTFGLVYDDLYAIYQRTKRPAEAEKIFQAKVANNPAVAAYRLQLAAHYINNNKPGEMEAVLRPLREDAKTYPTGKIEVGEFYMRLGMWPQAQTVLEEASRGEAAHRLLARKRLIQALMGQKKLDEAIRVADETVKEFPRDEETRFVRASLWMDTHNPDRVEAAVRELEQLRQAKEKDPMYWLVLGQAYQRRGDRKRSAAALQEAVKLNRDFTPALVALAEMSMQTGQAAAALDYAQKAHSIAGADPQVRLLYATALMQAGRLNEARTELSGLIAAHPTLAAAHMQMGTLLMAEGRHDQAEAVFKRLYRPGQADVRVVKGLADSYLARGQAQRALELVSAEVKTNPKANEMRRLYGQTALAAKRYDLAKQEFSELARLEPKSALNLYLLGQSLRAGGDIAGALAALEKAEQLDPNDPVPISVLAFLLQEQGRNQDAVKKLRRVLELRPNDANTMNNLAYLLAETGGNLEEATQLAQRALKAAPNNSAFSDTLGWVYLKRKMPDSALGIFQNLAQKEPNNALYLYHLGAAQAAKGQNREARASFEKALKNNPPPHYARQIQDALANLSR